MSRIVDTATTWWTEWWTQRLPGGQTSGRSTIAHEAAN